MSDPWHEHGAVEGPRKAPDTLAPGDIVRIEPPHPWAGCLAEVSEIRSFGCQAFVMIPHNDGTPTGAAYIRLAFADFTVIARAEGQP